MTLDVETEITTVELTLLRVLRLAFMQRGTAVADIATLRSADYDYAVAVTVGALQYVTAEANVFEWVPTSTATDDGVNAVKPASITGAGRWLRVTEPWTYGANVNAPLHGRASSWAREIVLYEGEDDGESLVERIGGNVPALLLRWLGDNPKSLLTPGAQYRNEHSFTILLMTRNMRQPGLSAEAVTGSALSEDAANDPGLNAIVGQVRKLLSGLVLCDGCQPIEVGAAVPGTASSYNDDGTEKERFFIALIALTLKTSYAIPDEDLTDPFDVEIDPQLADQGPDEAEFAADHIAVGLGVAPGVGLSFTIPAGQVVVGGVTVSIPATSHTFSGSSSTYRDVVLATGALTFTSVGIGDPAPTLANGSFRVGVTMTDAANRIDDTFLASVAESFAFLT